MVVSEAQLDQLVALGRRTGVLTIEDLKRVLPIESMSPDQLASVIARLEERDISVEVDASLLTPHRRNLTVDTTAAVLPPEPSSPRVTVSPAPTLTPESVATPEEGRARPVADRYATVRPILPIVAGVALLLLLLAVWWYLA